MITKNRMKKHKNHVRKTQLDRAFCIQNFLDATLALELLFILECWATPGLEERFKTFTNSPINTIGSCAWGTCTFGLFARLATCNLKQFGRMCPDFPQKWQTHAVLSCNLTLRGLGVIGLDFLRSTLIFLGGVTSASLTISLTGGSEEETKFVEWFLEMTIFKT